MCLGKWTAYCYFQNEIIATKKEAFIYAQSIFDYTVHSALMKEPLALGMIMSLISKLGKSCEVVLKKFCSSIPELFTGYLIFTHIETFVALF